MRRAAVYGSAALLLAIGGATAAAAPASASPRSTVACHPPKAGWKCSATSGSATAELSNDDFVTGNFQAKGEHLYVFDYHANGHSTVVYLTVLGSGTRKLTSHGGRIWQYNLSYPENRPVWLKVCTSEAASAVCAYARPGLT